MSLEFCALRLQHRLQRIAFAKPARVVGKSGVLGDVLRATRPEREVEVVNAARAHLEARRASGEFILPAGASYTFAGSYENQVRSAKRLSLVLPIALLVILVILQFQFRRIGTTAIVFSGVVVAWAGGFLMLWLYGQPWFLDTSVLGASLRELFSIHTVNLSVAVWVGFIALFGGQITGQSVEIDTQAEGIGYVSHPYPQKVEPPYREKWERDFGFVADKYPVFVTEFGRAEPLEQVVSNATTLVGNGTPQWVPVHDCPGPRAGGGKSGRRVRRRRDHP